MAKKKAIVKYRTRVVRAARRFRRSGGASITGVAVGSYIVGVLEKQGTLAKLPTVVADPILNAGLVAYAVNKWGRIGGRWLRDASVGAIAVGAYRMGAGQSVLGIEMG